ncbi:hypothetical protein HPB50_002999 [Hyalomma asiaticum]|uniref:Uncharacterized protein n=1 Tax=Hyalomma asiaticum TaxID=266040 RepID=A0ACB7T6T2_HYAAI|nr:hypothetical protein HPB50_002999 [Hyalomma asiaticum]
MDRLKTKRSARQTQNTKTLQEARTLLADRIDASWARPPSSQATTRSKRGRTRKKRTTSRNKPVSTPPSLPPREEPYFSVFSGPTADASPRRSSPAPPNTDGQEPTDQVAYLLERFDTLYRPY